MYSPRNPFLDSARAASEAVDGLLVDLTTEASILLVAVVAVALLALTARVLAPLFRRHS